MFYLEISVKYICKCTLYSHYVCDLLELNSSKVYQSAGLGWLTDFLVWFIV